MKRQPDVSCSGSEVDLSHYFFMAEHLYKAGRKQEAVPLFRHVIDNVNDTHHPQYIMSQFRLFQSLIGIGSEENKEALARFESHYFYLPDDVKLDALLQMANVYYTLWDWKKVERYADELRTLARTIYDRQLENKKNSKPPEILQSERHLVVYYGQGFLLKGVALTMQERFEEAKHYVSEYSELGWFEFLDEIGHKEVEKFRIWGKANMYNLELKCGNDKVLDELSEFLDENPIELLPSLLTVIESANMYNFKIDEFLDKFCTKLPPINTSVTYINGTQLFHFRYEKAVYSFRNQQITTGLNELLHALYLSQKMKHYSGFERCVTLFAKHIDYATEQQKRHYRNLLEGVSDL
ncbi:DNA-binding protein [Paenibacillus ehimensis]|uniref:hypothetical protein n=1 Tax=Paenibacillus ehimensis TaxID=79264 RepID=UPI000470C0B5|nr:hypothetical protein [Paenibacillus ehimensis]MEC0213344.1 DNA-binding protein [Paenibacillus ehimensis]